MLQRMRELVVQSENGINSDEELTAIQDEIDQLTTELDRVANTTEFSGIELLSGDYAEDAESLDFLVGARGTENEVISIHVGDMSASNLGTLGDTPPAALDGGEDGVAGVDVTNDDQSVEQQLEMIDAAIADVGSQRAELGAIQNRFQSTIANLTNVSTKPATAIPPEVNLFLSDLPEGFAGAMYNECCCFTHLTVDSIVVRELILSNDILYLKLSNVIYHEDISN